MRTSLYRLANVARASMLVMLAVGCLSCGIKGSGGVSPPDTRAGTPAPLSAEQREVAAMPVPAGVDAQLWEELQAALIAALGDTQRPDTRSAPTAALGGLNASPTRNVSAPPTGTGAQAELLYIADGSELSWRYASPGDYDQNGEVNGADLAPLAVHIGKRAESLALGFPRASIESLVDGDGNGEINAADIVPIAANFRNRVEGYRVYSGPLDAYPQPPNSPNGPGAELVELVMHSQSELTPGERRRFSVAVGDAETTRRFWVRPFEGEADGPASNNVTVPAASNQSPTAHLIAGPPGGATPFSTTLTAAGSVDPDGQIVQYEWDLDGDGIFEHDGGATPATPLWFYAPGSFEPRVRVTDDDGAQTIASVTINVTEGAKWHIHTLDDGSPVDTTSILAVNGKPAIVYNRSRVQGQATYDLSYRLANSPEGTGWGNPITLGPTPGARQFSAAIIGGRPAAVMNIAGPPPSNTPRFQRALNATGSVWGEIAEIAPDFPAYLQTYSLTEVAGMPAATYVAQGGSTRLRFSRALDAEGTAWSPPVPIGGWADHHTLRTIAGRPAVVYSHPSLDGVVFTSAGDAEGTVWHPPLAVDFASGAKIIDLAEVDDRPALAYWDGLLEAVKFVRALDPEGLAWEAPRVIAQHATSSLGVRMSRLPDGRPAVVYVGIGDDTTELRFIAANDPAGESWTRPLAIGPEAVNFAPQTVALEAGLPHPAVLFASGTGTPVLFSFAAYY